MTLKTFFAAGTLSASIALTGCAGSGGMGQDLMNSAVSVVGDIPVVNEVSGVSDFQNAKKQMEHAQMLTRIITPESVMEDGSLRVPAKVVAVEVVEVEKESALSLTKFAETAEGLNATYAKVAAVADPVGYAENAEKIGDTMQAVKIGSAVFDAFTDKEMIEAQVYTLATEDGFEFTAEQPVDVTAVYAVGDDVFYRSMSSVEAEENMFYVEGVDTLASN